MSQAISTQHPAVVLRSRYQQLRALLVVAMIAVVGLTAAVVILASQNDGNTIVRAASPANVPSASASVRTAAPRRAPSPPRSGLSRHSPAPMRAVSRRQSGPAKSGLQLPRAPTRAPWPTRFRAARCGSSFPLLRGPLWLS